MMSTVQAPPCCSVHRTTCGHQGVCCTSCPTRREGTLYLLVMAVAGVAVLVLLAIAVAS